MAADAVSGAGCGRPWARGAGVAPRSAVAARDMRRVLAAWRGPTLRILLCACALRAGRASSWARCGAWTNTCGSSM